MGSNRLAEEAYTKLNAMFLQNADDYLQISD